ncbi:ABC transporter ATP-binding protein [Promineifilum sp.]|uniref:ABC transporter ATP-binding protein n=1 Tax=Promineifilum sp. TaxID=2664178 RepID=UPI0035ADC08C
MAFLEIDQLTKQFGTMTAVSGFDLDVEQGEFISLLGPSGCGKTTALRMVAGFERPTSGAICLNGRDITTQPPNQRHIGMVFQSYALFPNMTVADNVGFGLKLKGLAAADARRRAGELLELIQLPDKGKSYPYQLSGGQQQRVALARALAIEPQVLLLDEPLSALDAKIRVELRAEIRRIQQQLHITTLYVTHDQEEAMSLSDRVVVMNKGFIEQVGTPFEIYNYPTTAFAAHFVGQLNVLPGRVLDAAAGRVAVGDQTLALPPPLPAADGQPVKLAVRPEELEIGAAEGHNNLRGVVDSITFLGSIVRVRVTIGEASVIADLFNERLLDLPKMSEAVTVNFPAHAGWILEERG